MSFLIRAALVWIALLSVAQAAEDHAAIRKALAAVIPEAAPDEIRPAALPGLFEVTYGPEVLYVSEDGAKRITLLRPIPAGANVVASAATIALNDVVGGPAGPAHTLTFA